MPARIAIWLVAVAVCAAPVDSSRGEEPKGIAVVVSATREVEFSIEVVAQIYLKQRRFWKDGSPIVPINREADHPVRRSFSRAVFGDAAKHHDLYWNRQYFKGVLPPATLASDDAVARFVEAEPNAIGYLSSDRVGEGLRVLFVIPLD